MRFFHLSDLHIGKQLHHYNLREDQEHILGEVIYYAKNFIRMQLSLRGIFMTNLFRPGRRSRYLMTSLPDFQG